MVGDAEGIHRRIQLADAVRAEPVLLVRREVHEVPDIERQEIRDIYRSRGFEGELLEQIVDVVTSDEDRWVQQMMTDELGLPPEPPKPAPATY